RVGAPGGRLGHAPDWHVLDQSLLAQRVECRRRDRDVAQRLTSALALPTSRTFLLPHLVSHSCSSPITMCRTASPLILRRFGIVTVADALRDASILVMDAQFGALVAADPPPLINRISLRVEVAGRPIGPTSLNIPATIAIRNEMVAVCSALARQFFSPFRVM